MPLARMLDFMGLANSQQSEYLAAMMAPITTMIFGNQKMDAVGYRRFPTTGFRFVPDMPQRKWETAFI